MRDQRESEFMEMLARCERTLFKVCLFYTDRQPDNVRDMYQDIVCNLWQAWPSFRHESKANTWVYRVALNTAVARRQPTHPLLDSDVRAGGRAVPVQYVLRRRFGEPRH
ncbi:MAG: sigma-70 family RNA polymerase sigma factor [Bacteroidales bacterium]|nr:sigma-70 family RNA polymerase sigma factor [Bacteroidales bacterium]